MPSEETIRQSLELHPEVVVAKNVVQRQVQQRKIEKSEYWPKFLAQANYGLSGTDPGNLDGTYLYGGQMNVPIYQGGLRRARIQEATSRIHESEAQLEDTKRQQQSKAFSALESLKQTLVGLKAARAELTRTTQELNLAQHRFQTGLGSEIEVIDSRTKQALAKNQHSEALSLYRLAWVNLAHSLGDTEKWLKELAPP